MVNAACGPSGQGGSEPVNGEVITQENGCTYTSTPTGGTSFVTADGRFTDSEECVVASDLGGMRGPAGNRAGRMDLRAPGEYQTRTYGEGLFTGIVEGTPGDRSTKYLWTAENPASASGPLLKLIQEFPDGLGSDGNSHTNISHQASIGGEAWFGPGNTVTINNASGAFGIGSDSPVQFQAAVNMWESQGYTVNGLYFATPAERFSWLDSLG